MKRSLVVLAVLILAACCPAAAQSRDGAKLTEPPAIYLPAGGTVVTEINVSDDDVLGIVKQAIPAVADVVKDIASQQGARHGAPMVVRFASVSDVRDLSEAIGGIKNVRVLIVRYPKAISPESFVADFTMGAQKAGSFRKILSDFGTFPGAVGLYALPDNAGCMGFAYLPSERTAYAMRVVGGVDVPKLIKWAGGIAKFATLSRSTPMPEQPEVAQPTPQPNEAQPEPAQPGEVPAPSK